MLGQRQATFVHQRQRHDDEYRHLHAVQRENAEIEPQQVGVPQHVVVPEPYDPVSLAFKPCRPFGILLILVFAINLRVLPSGGIGGLSNLILPTITLALEPIGFRAFLLSLLRISSPLKGGQGGGGFYQ